MKSEFSVVIRCKCGFSEEQKSDFLLEQVLIYDTDL